MSTKRKLSLFAKYCFKLLKELAIELCHYYFNAFPVLLIIGMFRRIKRRFKHLFLPKGKGRPSTSEDLIRLILDMKRCNRGWGALRISQELAKLFISIHKKTVQRILKECGFVPPRLKFTPPPWEALIKSYYSAWAMDFMCVFDAFGGQLFVLVIIDIKSRALRAINATLNPDRAWVEQPFRNLAIGDVAFPKVLIADNDGIYGKWLVPTLKSFFHIKVHKIPPKMPWCNGVCERFHRTLRDEMFHRLILYDQSHVQALTNKFKDYYNDERPHQSMGGATPSGKILRFPRQTTKENPINYKKKVLLDGLITKFELAA